MQQTRLILVADYVCPFCFLAETVAARLDASGSVRVDGSAFELRPAGTPLPAADVAWPHHTWTRFVEPVAAAYGVSLARPALVTRTRKAHEAAAYARTQDRRAAMHSALYAAYWQQGRDIGRIDVLVEIGREVGLDPSGLRVALDIDQWAARVDEDEQRAARLGLSEVPAWVLTGGAHDGTAVAADTRVGLQRYEELRAWVERDDV